MQNKGGRPTSYSPDVKETILNCIRQGMTLKAACKEARISYSTLASWDRKVRSGTAINKPQELQELFTLISEERSRQSQAHQAMIFLNRKSRSYRYGWKQPMNEETRHKLRKAAMREIILEILTRQQLI